MNYDMKPFLPNGISSWKGPHCNLKRKHESNVLLGETLFIGKIANFPHNMT
jgi:hypothetical protein